MPTAYMTPDGDWAGNWYEDSPVADGLIEAPDGGGYGLRWNGKAWAADEGSEGRAEAYIEVPVFNRDTAAVETWKIVALIDRLKWQTAIDFSNSAGTPPALWAIIKYPPEMMHRASPDIDVLAWVIGYGPAETDDLFIRAAAL